MGRLAVNDSRMVTGAKVRGTDPVGRAPADQGVADLFFMMGIAGRIRPRCDRI